MAARLLGAKWVLLDVADVEGLIWKAVGHSTAAAELRPHEQDDLVSYLLAEAWIISERFDASRGSVCFSTFLYASIQRRIVDFVRRERGRTKWQFADRTYERPHVELVSLNLFAQRGKDDSPSSGDSEHGELGRLIAGSMLDSDAPGFASDMRALETRARRPSGRDNWMGDEAA